MIAASNIQTECTVQLYGLSRDGFSNAAYSFSYSFAGGPWPVNNWTINPSSGTQPFESGYGTLLCSESVEAQLLYSFYSPQGVKFAEATVFSSPTADVSQVLADNRDGSRLGLAIANDSDRPVTYTIRAGNTNGAEVGRSSVTLNAKTSRAMFLDELFPVPPNNTGQVLVSGPGNVIGIRFTQGVFTTIPSASVPVNLNLTATAASATAP